MLKNRKIIYILFTILFFAVCLVPSLGLLVFGEAEASANEILAGRPEVIKQDGSFNFNIAGDLTDYMAERFALRKELITVYAGINAAVFGESTEDDVVLGTDGWLFYEKTVKDYLHIPSLTERSAYGVGRTLSMMQEYAEKRNVKAVFTVAPNKNSLYTDHMPDVGRIRQDKKNLEILTEYLDKNNVNYADLTSAFESERDKGNVLYHRLDSHWNSGGAALALRIITDRLGVCPYDWYDSEYGIERVHEGDLYKMLYPAGSEMDEDIIFKRKFTFVYPEKDNADYYSGKAPRNDNQRIVTRGTGTGNLLMFRDSFGNSLYPFMAETFAESVFMRAMPYRPDLLDSGEYDYAVFEIVERNIGWLAERAPVFEAPVRETDRVPEDSNIGANVTVSDSETLPGYRLITGVYSGELCDTDTDIYLQIGARIYEACPVADASVECVTDANFTAYIPEQEVGDEIYVIAERGGKLIRQAGIIHEQTNAV